MSQRLNKRLKPKAANNQLAALVQARFQQALALYQNGQAVQAQTLFEEILKVQPRHLEALHLLGVIAAQAKNLQRAVALFAKAIEINPNIATFYFNRGLALQELHQFEAALASYDQAIFIRPDDADTCLYRGNMLVQLEQPEAALASYDQALALKPDYAEVWLDRGNILMQLERPEAASASYNQALALKPDYAEAHGNLGLALQKLRQPEAALASYDQALALKPDYAEAWQNRGNILIQLKKPEAALASYDQVIALKPDCAEGYSSRGNVCQELKQHQAAVESYDKALAIRPDYEFLYGLRLNSKMWLCDFRDVGSQFMELIKKIQGNEKASSSFPVITLSASLPLQRKAAEIWTTAKYPKNLLLGEIKKYPRHEKIRLGYFSMDFRIHPVSFLTAELFELHDRNRFEVIAFSYGSDTKDEMRQRLEGAFDEFIEVRSKSDQEIAEMARRMEIDIAIDLAGFTADARTGIFALRAAPVQVNFLGYPGTMGADYMDYLIADRQLIPEGAEIHYAEKIVYLPSFQPNDRKRKISDRVFTRAELGLPESGFVFCCFNNNYKITASAFAGWMRILRQVEGSVLWLYTDNSTAVNNLRQEAVQLGVEAQRLVFAQMLPAPEYLARYRYADLFLDTLPFNAGTTASDALWAGLPVLTCPGEAFASRMAASLLTAIEIPELIARTPEEYEALAVELATNPERLRAIRQKLERNRLTTPLFDSRLFARYFEEACTKMYERWHADLQPEHIYVSEGRGQSFSSVSSATED